MMVRWGNPNGFPNDDDVNQEDDDSPEGAELASEVEEDEAPGDKGERGMAGGEALSAWLDIFWNIPCPDEYPPSIIVSRFPLQGRSEVSKAPSGILPSGLGNIEKSENIEEIQPGTVNRSYCSFF